MQDNLAEIGKIDEVDVPTGACLLKRVGGSPYRETHDACDIILEATLKHPQIVRMLKKPVITASAEHDVPAMFKDVLKKHMAIGKPKG